MEWNIIEWTRFRTILETSTKTPKFYVYGVFRVFLIQYDFCGKKTWEVGYAMEW